MWSPPPGPAPAVQNRAGHGQPWDFAIRHWCLHRHPWPLHSRLRNGLCGDKEVDTAGTQMDIQPEGSAWAQGPGRPQHCSWFSARSSRWPMDSAFPSPVPASICPAQCASDLLVSGHMGNLMVTSPAGTRVSLTVTSCALTALGVPEGSLEILTQVPRAALSREPNLLCSNLCSIAFDIKCDIFRRDTWLAPWTGGGHPHLGLTCQTYTWGAA